MRLLVGDQGERLGLAARAGRRRHADGREHRLRRLAEALVVAHLAAVGQQEVDPLAHVHAAAAADGDQRVDCVVAGHLQGGGDVARRRVLLDLVEDEDLQAGLAQRGHGPLRVAGLAQPGVGDQQDAPAAQLAG